MLNTHHLRHVWFTFFLFLTKTYRNILLCFLMCDVVLLCLKCTQCNMMSVFNMVCEEADGQQCEKLFLIKYDEKRINTKALKKKSCLNTCCTHFLSVAHFLLATQTMYIMNITQNTALDIHIHKHISCT